MSRVARRVAYSAVHGFWTAKELAELADGPAGCGEVARGGCLFAWNLRVTRSAGETEQITHDAVTALVTRFQPTV